MDTLATAAASSDEVASQSTPIKSPPESESDSEARGNVPQVSVEEPQPTLTSVIDEEEDRKCSYRDFSQVSPKASNPSTRHKEPTFPMKLHMILSNPAFQHIISWLPHGRSWRILQQKAFEQRVIPLFFRHGRYSSFARQVNGWGFMRITHGSDFGSYYHERFLRGMPHLCEKMRRLTAKDVGARKKAEEERTPDFHAISRTHPIPEGPVVKDYPGVSEASFLARRAQMLQQVDLMAASNRTGPGMGPSMGMAGIGYPNGNLQDSLLNSMQFGGAPNNANMQANMQNNLLMRQFLAANMGGNPLGGGAPNFGVPNSLGMGGAPNFGASNAMQGMVGAPNLGIPNGMQGMGGVPNLGGPNGMGQFDMAQLLALQNGMQNAPPGPALAPRLWNQQYDEFNQFGSGMKNGV